MRKEKWSVITLRVCMSFFLTMAFISMVAGWFMIGEIRIVDGPTYYPRRAFEEKFFFTPNKWVLLFMTLFMVAWAIESIRCGRYKPLQEIEWKKHLYKFWSEFRSVVGQMTVRGMLHSLWSSLCVTLTPAYWFQPSQVVDATVVRRLDPEREQVSVFSGYFLELRVNRDLRRCPAVYTFGQTRSLIYLRVPKKVYEEAQAQPVLRVRCRFSRHFAGIAQAKLVI